VHEVEIDIINTERLERSVNPFCDSCVPGVIELGGDPYFFPRNTGILDSSTNLCFVAIGKLSFD
jgi:hypothetical protein